jgi:hypothetical protein
MKMGKIRLAIVGPLDSVSLAHEVALERSDYLDVVPIVYQDASEVAEILTEHKNDFDMWLFSGIVPYQRALAMKLNKPLFYIPHTGSSLYRALLQITYIEHLRIESVSFDTFSKKEVEETFTDIDLPLPPIYVNHYDGVISSSELTDYHYNLWKNGRTNIAITCFSATYEKLKKMGVPVFRIWPTRCNIRTTLDIAIETFEAQRFKGSQLAIQHIAIDDYDDLVRASSSYNVKRIELRLYEILVGYAEKLKGSIVLSGDGQFTLYSTRGILEEITEGFIIMPILEDMTRNVTAKVSGGIGFGSTAYAAEENAFMALGLAKQKGKGRWMVVTDNREVIGPLSSDIHLKYSVRVDETVNRQFADKLNISITTANKLLAALDKLDKEAISADDLALYLEITPRSARRLLTTLADQGIAESAGDEMVIKGRPRKLYKVFLEELLRPVMQNGGLDNADKI